MTARVRAGRARLASWLTALGAAALLGGSVLPARVHAQVRPDSTRRDTVRTAVPLPAPPMSAADSAQELASRAERAKAAAARRDSLAAALLGDTVKAPLANFERPQDFETTGRLRFDRDQILATSAAWLALLLNVIAGLAVKRVR